MDPLTTEELAAVLHACEHIHIDRCTPALLQPFLGEYFRNHGREALAAKVRRLDAGEMDSLCEAIKAQQDQRPRGNRTRPPPRRKRRRTDTAAPTGRRA